MAHSLHHHVSASSNMNVGVNEFNFLQRECADWGRKPVFPLAQLLYTWLGLPLSHPAGWPVAAGLLIHAEELAPFRGGIGDWSEVLGLTEARVCSPQRSLMMTEQKIHSNITSPSGCTVLRNIVRITFFFFLIHHIRPPSILSKVYEHTSCFLTGWNHISLASTSHWTHTLQPGL